jgi:hypothetical protein
LSLACFIYEHFKSRNIVVPFDQGWNRSEVLNRAFIQFPNGWMHPVPVGIEEKVIVFFVTGEMDFLHPAFGKCMQIFYWFEAVIPAADINIIDVE